jgi:hypothetical protein
MVAEPLMSIADQIARMKARWPRFTLRNIDRRGHAVHWIGIVQPQFSPYTLDVQYSLGSFPKVRVVSPSLTRLPDNPEGQLPHVYPPADDPTLCLLTPNSISGIGRCPFRILLSRGPAIGLPVTSCGSSAEFGAAAVDMRATPFPH